MCKRPRGVKRYRKREAGSVPGVWRPDGKVELLAELAVEVSMASLRIISFSSPRLIL